VVSPLTSHLTPLTSHLSPIISGFIVRQIQQLDRVCHADWQPCCPQPGANLHETAWITGGDQMGPGTRRSEARDLVIENCTCHPGLKHGVDPGTTATAIGSWQYLEPQCRDRTEQGERGLENSLGVLKMARRVIRHVQVDRGTRPGASLCQQL
jgi:hypothetical protein